MKKNHIFWWDFPDSRLKDELKDLIGIRALVPLTTASFKNQVFKILNKDEKIVSRITFQKIKSKGNAGKEVNLIYINPVRGYRDEAKAVGNLLSGIGLEQNKKDILSISLLETDLIPGSYTGKLNLKLKPEMTAQHAAVLIFRNLLSTLKKNEEGIIKDIDTEFLHDFRVSVRRTRAALSQIKAVFSDEIINKAKQDFSTLGKRTNLLRDLDVYLLKKEQYIDMLPLNLRPGLEPVFKKLETERKAEQIKLARFLRTKAYRNIITSWEIFLNSEDFQNFNSYNSDIPVIEMAKKFIIKKYKKIIKAGKLIDGKTPDPEIHSLRIECKKLRYLLEFFSSLFPKKEIVSVINQLKKLQDNLGDFNDLYMQQVSLKNFLSKIDYSNKNKDTISLSVGGLITVLNQKQHMVRSEFSQKFKEFSKAENIKLFKKLFS